MNRRYKAFLSAAVLIIFSIQLLLSTKIATSQTVGTHHPTGYNILGATTYISGELTHLKSDNSLYMTFRSYYSGTAASEFVDINTSDVDGSDDVGTLSNFDNMKTKDGMANLTEGAFGGGTVWLWQEDTSGYSATSSYETFQFWSSWTTNSTTSGTITKIGIYVFADPGNSPQVKLGIYDDSGGSPNNLLGETNAATISGTGWLDLDIVGGGINISASTTYHIAHITDSAPTTQWRYLKTATPVSDFRNFRVWPNLFDPAGSTTKSASYRYGAYRVGYDQPSDYGLDQEVQWTDVPYSLPNEELCIYCGTMGTEDIRVDVWYNSAWQNLLTDLSTGWNNVSVSSYLDSSTFTIRFKGGIETGDSTQDSWNIDVTLLHVWSPEYTTEVEFTGSSNTEPWAQLDWSVDSAWTVGSVSVTLQLYDYSLGDYSSNGNGYMSYTSNVTANTDVTKNQTITVNPTNFRNPTGYWRAKVKGVKITDTPFDFKVDLIKYEVTSVAPPDVAVLNVTGSLTSVYPGEIVRINVTVKNEGGTTETFNVTLYYDNTEIGKQLVSSLAPSANTTLTFNWNTTGVSLDTYTIEARADNVQGETDTADNIYVDGTVRVHVQSSPQPFSWVTTILYALPVVVVFLFLVTLKLKRKKETDTFSESFGMTHQQMIGKKMLLEIDPTSDYHKALISFVSEARNSGEPLFVFTSTNSTLHSELPEAENVKLFLLTSNTSYLQRINEKEILLPACDLSLLLKESVEVLKVHKGKNINILFDNISSVIIRCGFDKTYNFMHFLLEAFSSPKTTTLFVFNPEAHDPVISSSIRGLFRNQLAYTKSGPKMGAL